MNELRLASEAAVKARKDRKGFLDLTGQGVPSSEASADGEGRPPATGDGESYTPPADGSLSLQDLLDDPGYVSPADPRYGIRRPGPGVVERFE